MAVHVCRDFLTLGASLTPLSNIYFLALFLTGVLGFSRVGHTNADYKPLQKGFVVSGSGASVNLGTGKEYFVSVPTSSYLMSSSFFDSSRILVLKSRDYPRANSGLFRVLSASISDNAFIIDYRSTSGSLVSGSFPPIESGSLSGSLDWMLFDFEPQQIGNTNHEAGYFGNGLPAPNYATYGTGSNYPRVIYKSPHSSSWQVRLCWESYPDRWSVNGVGGLHNTFSVGLDGDVRGDWRFFGRNCHGLNFWNDGNATRRTGQQSGLAPAMVGFNGYTNGRWRLYIWGDDVTGSTLIFNRTSGFEGNAGFGMADNEPLPVPTNPIHRVFSFGRGTQYAPTINIGTYNEYGNSGQAFGFNGTPISMTFNCYHSIIDNAYPESLVTMDSLHLNATELVPVDVIAGTWLTSYIQSGPMQQAMFLEPRRMGIAPCGLRTGRNNFASWTTTTDASRSWFHVVNGIYMPWGGPPVLP